MARTKKKIESFRDIRSLNLIEKDTPAYAKSVISSSPNREGFGFYDIEISDCNSRISLHGSLSNPLSRKNALYKIQNLIEVLEGAKNHIESEVKTNNIRIAK